MAHRRRILLAALLAVAGGAACSTDDRDPVRGGSSPSAGTGSASPPTRATDPPSEPALVVVGHATRPQRRLSAAVADRLTSGDVRRWRGSRVVVARDERDAVRVRRVVERHPDALGVLPIDAVGPTVVAARVGGVDPVRDHPDATEVTVAGDLMLVRGVPDADAALAPMRDLLRRADLTIGNLESTLSTDGPPNPVQGDVFGGDPSLVGVLRRAGFDGVSLANNHTGDHGPQALVDTVDILRDGPVPSFGAGADVRAAARALVLEAGGTSYAFVGFNSIGETAAATRTEPGALSLRMPPRTGPFNDADLERVVRAVRRAGRRADAVIVLPHWGEQYTHAPWPEQRRVARALVRAGADLVVGGHPHWVQGIDAVDGVPVLHSLGNFVFDMDWEPEVMEGVVLQSTWWGAELKAIRLVPYAMEPGSFAPRVVRGERARDILGDVRSTSTGPFAD